jgi:hypothetical protein
MMIHRHAVFLNWLLLTSSWMSSFAFTSRSTFVGSGKERLLYYTSSRQQSFGLTMRDRSASYWFQVGDTVKVVDDVVKAGSNLRERQGVVVQTWEKCEVDPTCCCAEQVSSLMTDRFYLPSNADQH